MVCREVRKGYGACACRQACWSGVRWGEPAILNGIPRGNVVTLDEAPGPVQVEAVEPVVIYAEGILQVFNGVVPAAGNKNALASLLIRHHHEPSPHVQFLFCNVNLPPNNAH